MSHQQKVRQHDQAVQVLLHVWLPDTTWHMTQGWQQAAMGVKSHVSTAGSCVRVRVHEHGCCAGVLCHTQPARQRLSCLSMLEHWPDVQPMRQAILADV